jgi:S-adenosylmethionine:tRNA ribosyltransferase-isomerase
VLVSDFHYDLPQELIAQEPLGDRSGSRMLHLSRKTQTWQDRMFRELPDILLEDDLLVVNNTRVFPARLYGRRSGIRSHPVSTHNPAAREFLQGQVEVLLTRQVSTHPNEWECLVRPGRKIGTGEKILFGDPVEMEAEVIERGSFGERRIRFQTPANSDFFAGVEKLGHIPLPPYINREDRPCDRERYQTIYARARGSVAAPTAGLHFTGEIMDRIRRRGIEIAEVTLHVGLGTFQPVRVEKLEDHKLHHEHYEIPEATAALINAARANRRRVVAVGTTTVRTLEFAAQAGPDHKVLPGRGEANLFVYPGYEFRIVDALLTNFHLPESTLLMLVCALAGKDFTMSAYRHAVDAAYRFYSYGDCMFVE